MFDLNNKIDEHDLAYFIKLYGFPLASRPCLIQKNGKINPHESRFLCKDGKTLVSMYHVEPIYYQTIIGTWRPLSEVAYETRNHLIVLKEDWHEKMHPYYLKWLEGRMKLIDGKIFVSNPYLKELQSFQLKDWLTKVRANLTLTKIPDADPTTTTVDGHAGRDRPAGSNESWTTIHDSTGDSVKTNLSSTAASENILLMDSGTNGFRQMARAFLLYDTSSLGSGASISATTIGVGSDGKSDAGTAIAPTMNIFTTTPASNTTLATGDYQQIGTVNQAADITFANWDTTNDNTKNTFTFNATGRGNVSKTGVSKFGARESKYDAPNSAPTWSGSSAHDMSVDFADNATAGARPLMTVTYSLAGGANKLSLLGVS